MLVKVLYCSHCTLLLLFPKALESRLSTWTKALSRAPWNGMLEAAQAEEYATLKVRISESFLFSLEALPAVEEVFPGDAPLVLPPAVASGTPHPTDQGNALAPRSDFRVPTKKQKTLP
jgi:hypothetical protein